MSRLVSEALLSYDFVLLDSPPLFINVADARILTPIVDGTVLVVRSGMTPRDVVRHTLAQCPNIIGIVLNDVNIEELPGCYRAYYGAEPGSVAS
jgi:Mrp family chromosome partitioning ATPase